MPEKFVAPFRVNETVQRLSRAKGAHLEARAAHGEAHNITLSATVRRESGLHSLRRPQKYG